MAEDDPEERIADLERRLAQPRAAGVPDAFATSDRLTPEQVHNVAFSKPPLFKRGYSEDEVDAFLDRVESTLRDPTAFGATHADGSSQCRVLQTADRKAGLQRRRGRCIRGTRHNRTVSPLIFHFVDCRQNGGGSWSPAGRGPDGIIGFVISGSVLPCGWPQAWEVVSAFVVDSLGAVLCSGLFASGHGQCRGRLEVLGASQGVTGAVGRHRVGNSIRLPGWVV